MHGCLACGQGRRAHQGACWCICVCRQRAGGVDTQEILDLEMPRFSLPCGSPVTWEPTLPEPQFPNCKKGMLRLCFTRLLRRSEQMDTSGLPGPKREDCSGGEVWGGVVLLPLGPRWSCRCQAALGLGERRTQTAAPSPSPVTSFLASLAAQGSTKSGHHLSFLAVAVMQTASAQLPIQVSAPTPLPSPAAKETTAQCFCFSVLFIRPWRCA